MSDLVWILRCKHCESLLLFPRATPAYHFGIGSLLVSKSIELSLFFLLRYAFISENVRKENLRVAQRAQGVIVSDNMTAVEDLTDKENVNFLYIYQLDYQQTLASTYNITFLEHLKVPRKAQGTVTGIASSNSISEV